MCCFSYILKQYLAVAFSCCSARFWLIAFFWSMVAFWRAICFLGHVVGGFFCGFHCTLFSLVPNVHSWYLYIKISSSMNHWVFCGFECMLFSTFFATGAKCAFVISKFPILCIIIFLWLQVHVIFNFLKRLAGVLSLLDFATSAKICDRIIPRLVASSTGVISKIKL